MKTNMKLFHVIKEIVSVKIFNSSMTTTEWKGNPPSHEKKSTYFIGSTS